MIMTPQARKHAAEAADWFRVLAATQDRDPAVAAMAAHHAAAALGLDPPQEYAGEINDLLAAQEAAVRRAAYQYQRSLEIDRRHTR